MLEAENKKLREDNDAKFNDSFKAKATVSNDDRNWMSSFGGGSQASQQRLGGIERPVTASAQNAKVREV